ncbi:AraC family transcriptional regulator [Olivibacter sp. SDN3]|uniref:AraC family transcriptional regulator n=1 Tax=Olivibacter sp. SDN3 TaxID=2764720 RepID=UPI0016514918|nr:AraC family transcriptional regulator [Olivibacter sp. SDN3]QNL51680.1 AraC family transcriptional regulator [Olivibacter sp. SDN3]
MHVLYNGLFAFLATVFFAIPFSYAAVDTTLITKKHLEIRKLVTKDPQQALTLAKECVDLSEDLADDSLTARSYYLLGLGYYYISQFDVSSAYYKKALESPVAAKDIDLQSSCWNNLGINYEMRMKYSESLDAYLKSLRIAEQLADAVLIGKSWINIGLLYAKLNNEKEANHYLYKALDFFTKEGDQLNMALCYQNIGLLLVNLGKVDEGIAHERKALKLYEEIADTQNQMYILYNLANIYSQKGLVPQSNQYIVQTEAINDKYGDQLITNHLRFAKAENAFTEGKLVEAERLLHEAKAGFNKIDAQGEAMHVNRRLMDFYAASGRYDEYVQLRESNFKWFEEEYVRKESAHMAELKILYEQEKKDLQLESQDRLIHMKTRENWLLYSSLTILLLAMGSLSILYVRLKTANRVLLKKNREEINYFKQYDGSDSQTAVVITDAANPVVEDDRFKALHSDILEIISKQKNFGNPNFNMADLAYQLHTNERYISSAINQHSGMNFNRLVNSFRVNEAKKMLLNPTYRNLSNDQLADRVGFGNVNTFYRQFKEFTGFTPMKFKKLSKL